MTCYKPLLRIEDLSKWEIAKDGHRYHPARIASTESLELYDNYKSGYYNIQQINCEKCIGCRLDYSREWANRGYLESLSYKHNYFITLTYDEENLYIPEEITTKEEITYTEIEEIEWKGCLVPKEIPKFMHDIRQYFERKLKHKGIRFMACGEYGGEGKRPHYHLILFNAPFPVESFYNPRINWEKNIYYQNHIIERYWKKGISNICEANWNNIAYVARYITKKVNGKESEDFYAAQGQIKEFFRTSRNPGIAKKYYEENKAQIYRDDSIMIRNKKGIHYVKPPKYFDKMYEKEHPKEFEKIKQKRKKETINNLKLKSLTTSLTRWEQLQVERATKEDAASTLKRNLERGTK